MLKNKDQFSRQKASGYELHSSKMIPVRHGGDSGRGGPKQASSVHIRMQLDNSKVLVQSNDTMSMPKDSPYNLKPQLNMKSLTNG